MYSRVARESELTCSTGAAAERPQSGGGAAERRQAYAPCELGAKPHTALRTSCSIHHTTTLSRRDGTV